MCVEINNSLFALQKPAFSKDDLLPMDLGTFYREFQNPPQLTSLSIDVSAQSMAEDLVRKTLGMINVLVKDSFVHCPVSLHTLSIDHMCILQDSLPEKLAIYEKNIDEFDAFVDTLQ